MTEFFEGCRAFYDSVTDYMDKFFSWGCWLCVCSKGQFFYDNFLPICFDVPISLKHEDKFVLWDHLLDWLHWKLEFT